MENTANIQLLKGVLELLRRVTRLELARQVRAQSKTALLAETALREARWFFRAPARQFLAPAVGPSGLRDPAQSRYDGAALKRLGVDENQRRALRASDVAGVGAPDGILPFA